MENQMKYKIKTLPPSPKRNINLLQNNNILYQTAFLSNQDKSYKIINSKESFTQEPINQNKNMKSISHLNFQVNLNDKEIDYQPNNNNCSRIKDLKPNNLNYQVMLDKEKENEIKRDMLRNKYNNELYKSDGNNIKKSRNKNIYKNLIVKNNQTEYFLDTKKSLTNIDNNTNNTNNTNNSNKNETSNNVNNNYIFLNDIQSDRNLYQNYNNNYVDHVDHVDIWGNKNKSCLNFSLDMNNKTYFNNVCHKMNGNNTNLRQNFSDAIPNETSQIMENKNNTEKRKIIHSIKNTEIQSIQNINESISLEQISNKLEQKVFNKSSNNFYNFYYQKPIIEKRKQLSGNKNSRAINFSHQGSQSSKANSKIMGMKNVFVKNITKNANNEKNKNNEKNENINIKNLSSILKEKKYEKKNENNETYIYI
jgi:hypothetical protein